MASIGLLKLATEYNMNHSSRGKAFIFVMKNYSPRLNFKIRQHAESESVTFTKSFVRLGFKTSDISLYYDCTRADIETKLNKAACMDHENNDCVAVAILTYGSTDCDCIYAYDEKFNLSMLCEPFVKCQTLIGKPKIFFVQASQAEKKDNNEVTKTVTHCFKLPYCADIVMSYSTLSGFTNLCNNKLNSWFNEAFFSTVHEYGAEFDLLTILTLVNQKIVNNFKDNDGKKRVPCFHSMLTRPLYFRPKLIYKHL